MGLVRRLTVTVSSHFNWIINQIENHEALVDAAIGESQAAVSKAKAQLARVTRDGQRLMLRLEEARTTQTLWQDRALKLANEQPEKALECLKRRNVSLALVTQLQEDHLRHQELETQLAADIATLQQRIRALKEQRNLMRTRESRANAARIIGEHEDHAFAEIDNIFERWEARIGEYEAAEALRAEPDSLEQECVTQEEREGLQRELATLLATSQSGQ